MDKGSGLDELAVRRVAALVAHAHAHAPELVEPTPLAEDLDLICTRVTGLVNLLLQADVVDVLPDGRMAGDADPEQPIASAVRIVESHRLEERSRVEMMRSYAETTGCRRRLLLAYFGEEPLDPCGNWDTCERGTATASASAEDSLYQPQSHVRHRARGDGVVMQYEGDRIVVLFEQAGYRTLLLEKLVPRFAGARGRRGRVTAWVPAEQPACDGDRDNGLMAPSCRPPRVDGSVV